MWAFFFTPIGRWLAILGIGAFTLVGASTAAYIKGRLDCNSAAQVRVLKDTADYLAREIARRDARTQADNAQREIDRAELQRLDEENRKLGNELKDRDSCGLSDDTVDRLRKRWGR